MRPRLPQALLNRLKTSWWFAWLTAAVLALASLKDASEGIEKTAILLGLKPDALALARSVEEGQFARDFSETAWRRLFWANAYIGRVEAGFSSSDINDAYKSYVAATEAWHTKLMSFELLTRRFHGRARAEILSYKVAPAMNALTDSVRDIRTQRTITTDHNAARAKVEAVNIELRAFILGTDGKV